MRPSKARVGSLHYQVIRTVPSSVFGFEQCEKVEERDDERSPRPSPAPSFTSQSTLGLEHLSLLEQLDLGHNLISKAVSVRALSFNRSLKLLWLEGNPFAADPRYRPTLICLLPHVRAIDRKGMPRSSTSERRSLSDSRELTKERGVHAVSREVQEEHDVRRSNDWRQV